MSVIRAKNKEPYILPIILFPILFSLTIFKMIDTDIWFHMKAGQTITETGRFIYKDIFSYTAAGRDWLYHEWLFGVLSYKVYTLYGINGLILGKAVLLAVVFIFIYKDMRLRDVDPYIASFVLFLAVLAARFRFTERPHIFKFLFVALFIYILDLYRLKGKRRLCLLPVLQALWTNIHGSFILGPILIGIYLFSGVVSKEKSRLNPLISVLIITSLVTLINPYGFRLIYFSLGFGEKTVLSSISEWAPTRFRDFYGALGLLFAGGTASFVLRYKDVKVSDILMFVVFAYLSVKAVRFTALFSLASAPIIADNFGYIISQGNRSRLKKIISLFLGSVIVVLFAVQEVKKYDFGFGEGSAFPQRAVDFLKQHPIDGNMYNSYVFGGYLIWGFYPETKVFVDGRAEVYDKEFQDAFIGKITPSKWFEAISRYDINYAVVAYYSGGLNAIGELIADDPNWVLVYWDDAARVYVRNVPRNGEIIKRFGHQVMINPRNFNYGSLKTAVTKGLSKGLESELRNDVESNPENSKAFYWLGMLYYETGRKEEAVTAWQESVRITPDANTYSSIGNVFTERGMHQKAIGYYEKAIETDRGFVAAYYNLGISYEAVNRKDKAFWAYEKFIRYAGPEYAGLVTEVRKKLREATFR